MKKLFFYIFIDMTGCIAVKAQQPITVESVKANSLYTVQDSVLIKTKDGSYISALVVKKREIKKPLPVILQYTIYARQSDINKVKLAADKDYVGIIAYT
ncbi:MAG: peptidase S15, partial [Chitinophagaceae bacterium]|nr:peptidase S15 [Chitinophagaceae bacterium]